jgi:hypothetical protein
MISSTSAGAIPLAEQNRIKDDSLQRTIRELARLPDIGDGALHRVNISFHAPCRF